jgi:hypothetical protein
VGPLGPEALREVIERPAWRVGLELEPGLVEIILADVADRPGSLPLMEYALSEVWQRRRGRMLTFEAYKSSGGVTGALSQQADKVTAELQAADPTTPVLSTLLKFVTVEETEPTRRRVQRSTLGPQERRVVDAFVAARLLTSDAAGDDAVIEVAHEALFRQWPPLRQAIEACVEDLRQRAELERWAADWVRSGRSDSYLLRDERLRIAQRWAAAHGNVAVELPLVHEFLDRSGRLDRATLERLSEAVARRALASVDHDPEQGMLLALAAIEECVPTRLAQRALLAALAAARVRGIMRGHEDWVLGVGWSPDGQRVATASGDRTVWVWDAKLAPYWWCCVVTRIGSVLWLGRRTVGGF